MNKSHKTGRFPIVTTCLLLLFIHAENTRGAEEAEAIFAGGCFWCMEPPFDALDGVLDTVSGYSGGNTPNPTYQQVSSGKTGHAEVLLVRYNPEKISYQKLLDTFWRNIDPVDSGGQFCDRGSQYRSEIFALDQNQLELAKASLRKLAEVDLFDAPIATVISKAQTFYPAEDYHQNYYEKNPVRYKYYKWNCGRQQRLDAIWKYHPASPDAQ
jgi:peptide-methionine (S)-S-oxide reductase